MVTVAVVESDVINISTISTLYAHTTPSLLDHLAAPCSPRQLSAYAD